MMHRARVSMSIYCGERSRTIAAGEIVDLDEVLRPDTGLTVRACVTLDHFTAEAPAVSDGGRPTRKPRPGVGEESA
jgi:hypothetical protein